MGTGPQQRKRHFFAALNPIVERAKRILNLETRGKKREHDETGEANEPANFRVKKESILPNLPFEIWLIIFKKLPLSTLANVARVSRFFLAITNENSLWRIKATENGIPEFLLENQSGEVVNYKEQLHQFLLECARLKEVYPQPLLNAFERIEHIAALPPLAIAPENHGYYLNFIKPAQMMGHKMKRGQTDRPFLTFCARIAGENKILVQTLFQRYLHNKNVWVAAGDRILPEGEVGPKAWDYLRRLIAGEPCGVLGFPEERKPLTHDGENMVSLSDQLPKSR